MHTQPIKNSAGGVALYLTSSLNYKTRDNLSVTKDDFEMVICVELLSQAEKILYVVVFTDTQTLMYKNS